MDAGADIAIAAPQDAAGHARAFARDGHVHIPDFLRDDDAGRIFDALAFRTPWRLMLIDDGPHEITQEKWAEMGRENREKFDAAIMAAGQDKFAGRFCSLRFSDDGETYAGDSPELVALSRFLNGEQFLSYVRSVTAAPQIALADAQATLYRPGDFLNTHHDVFPAKKRVAAYVLSLTPRWQPEWGGLLAFPGADGQVARAYAPAWNALNILRVPQPHFVSWVTPFGKQGRYSVTGWLRHN